MLSCEANNAKVEPCDTVQDELKLNVAIRSQLFCSSHDILSNLNILHAQSIDHEVALYSSTILEELNYHIQR